MEKKVTLIIPAYNAHKWIGDMLRCLEKQTAKSLFLVTIIDDGSKETYRIPEGTQTGTKFTIRGKGFKSVTSSSVGDFVFTVNVQTPKKLTKEQRELLVQLARTMNEQPPIKKRGIFG